jgi:hypothetical protein
MPNDFWEHEQLNKKNVSQSTRGYEEKENREHTVPT